MKSVRLIAFALIFAVGCAAPQRKLTPLAHEEIAPESPDPVAAQPVEPAPLIDRLEPTQPMIKMQPPAQPIASWVSLHEWCAQHMLPPPEVSSNAMVTNVVIHSTNGIFAFEPPRRNARWNGVLFGVGFAPIYTNRQLVAHSIDLDKVVQPLVLSDRPTRTNGGVLVIDAGHGGSNDGALSHNRKLKEKDLTLDWAVRVQKLLEGSKWQVYMTRTSDVDLALTQRVAFAESKKADLFISLHFNSFSKAEEAGLETYCITPQGTASHVTRGYADDAMAVWANNEFDVENILLAHDLHRAMLKKTGRKDRGIRRARFMTVLREQRRPAVLLEGGYLSNVEEAKLIGSPQYRQKLAEAVAEALGVIPSTLTSLRE